MFKERGFILGLVTATLLLAMPLSRLYGQSKSFGATFSFSGFALSYEHDLKRYNSFVEASLKAETAELFLYRTVFPGISGSVTWNIPLKDWISSDGNRIVFFAGPGLVAGYGQDYKMPPGVFFGLKGRVGLECNFSRRVVISAFLSPILGSHIEYHSEHIIMRTYRNGIIWALSPEVGVKYRF